MNSRTVTIVCKSVPEYRVAFFSSLRRILGDNDINLRVVYGQATGSEASRGGFRLLNWGTEISNRSIRLGSRELIWQPCLKAVLDSDLVIVEQASKLLTNHVLFALHSIGKTRLAFWGHGKNLKSHSANKAAEKLKAFESKRVHWWFAYTELTVELLRSIGFPENRITLVENTIDIRSLEDEYARLSPADLDTTRQQLGISGANCALFIGGMYPEKRLSFLFEAAQITRSLIPDFELLLIGAGPQDHLARAWTSRFDWIHYLGAQTTRDKARFFAPCKLLLLPGLVGLAIVDSFALRLPMLTVDVPYHSPEIAYLRNHENGVMLPAHTTPAEYAQATVALLRDEHRRRELIRGCERSAASHRLEDMVARFSEGVELAITDT